MKTSAPARLTVVCLCLALAAAKASAGDPHLRIAVRSDVDRPFQGWGKAPLVEHSKIYYLAYLKEAPSVEPLVKPVDQARLRRVLADELAKRGFRPMRAGEKPGVILTVHYGRGFLRNPYLKGISINEFVNPPVFTLTGLDSITHLAREREAGYEEKLQNAQFEKLFIRVTAWADPGDGPPPAPGKREKPRELWHTTVLIDDPANRDLNLYVQQMLAAASSAFDHPVEDEAIINTALPEGHVKMGDAKVMPSRRGDDDAR